MKRARDPPQSNDARDSKRPRRDGADAPDAEDDAEPLFRQLDRMLAARIETFFSDEALVFDEWLREKIAEDPEGLGCGLPSTIGRHRH